MAALQFDKFNAEVKAWGNRTSGSIKTSGAASGIFHRNNSPSKSASLPQVKDSYKFRDGAINKISFKFPRTLIFTHKGAGKGMAGTAGSKWIDKHGVIQRTNANSMGKLDSGNRRAKPFFNKIIESEVGQEELATIAAVELGDTIVGNILIK